MDDQERPSDRARIGELPHRPPKTGTPYTREEVLRPPHFFSNSLNAIWVLSFGLPKVPLTLGV
jgi:hypothetical protein